MVQYLCEQGGDKGALDRWGISPLYIAAEEGHLPMVQYLCEQEAYEEARDDVVEEVKM